MAKRKTDSALAERFTLARDRYMHRMIASVEGEVGTGKTHFGLTGPAPILVQSIDKGTEGTIEKFRNGELASKEIYEESYDWEAAGIIVDEEDVLPDDAEEKVRVEGLIQEQAIEIRNKWEKDLFYAIDNGIRTVMGDTESRIWQVYRYAEFGGPNADNVRDYDKLNGRFERIVNRCKAADVNLFLVRSTKDKWGVFNGKFGKKGREVWGYDHLPGCMNEEFTFIHRTDKEQEEAGDGLGEYVIRIGKCRINPALQFTLLPRCTFTEMGMELVPGSEEGDWQ